MRLATLLVLLLAATVPAADDAGGMDPEMAKAMALMSTTGVEHENLKKAVGTWDVKSTMWMAEGAPPIASAGTATFTVVLDGKWVQQEFAGDWAGMPFKGLGLSGYDTVAKQYVAIWCDSASTMMGIMKGESADGGKTVTYHSRMEHCPITGGPIEHRFVLNQETDDRILFQCFETREGQKERKSMELVYTRKK